MGHFRAVLLGICLGIAQATHYEKPPCASDEVAAQLNSGGELCAPACDGTTCPSDVPSGVTASPKCVLKDQKSGKQYCGLICHSNAECGTDGATCSKVSMFIGICTYPAQSPGVLSSTQVTAESEEEKLFKEFEQAASKVYHSEEERLERFQIFVENLVHIKHAQLADSGATYSHLSPFADWSLEEFAARNNLQAHLFDKANSAQAPLLGVSDLPDSFDWREKGAVNPVKNQAQCGSCWAFSTVANIEGVNFLKTQNLVSLSEQELVDCDKKTGDQGCQGGLPSNAFKDMIENKIGLELESQYPYTAHDGSCKAAQAKEKVFISNWTAISTDEDQIAAALMKYGPLSIGINAGPMQFYTGGIAKPWKIFCNPKRLDHGVAIVGFGEQTGTKYWIIRNSWGPTWGEKGYYRIIRGTGACGLNTMVTTSSIGGSDIVGELVI